MTTPKKGTLKAVKTPVDAKTTAPQTLDRTATEKTETTDPADFPIGASAGGLAAFEAFFSGMPAKVNSNMAFVLVQHLAPDHKSILSNLIRQYTRMQVFEVEDGMPIEPNYAYIIRPNCDMALLNGTLQLLTLVIPRGQRLPIDFFFHSLAQDQHDRAIAGSDGALGMRAIKGENGMIMLQTPESTEFDGMPRSAITTGLVDFVLPPAEIPTQLIAYVNQVFSKRFGFASIPPTETENMLRKIFILLRAQPRPALTFPSIN